MRNPFKLLADLSPKPALIPSQVATQHLSEEDKVMLRRVGIVASQLSQDLQAETAVNYDRARFYSEITRAQEHPLIGAALGLYADYSSMYNHLHNASVWATSENPTYQKELTKLLDRIGIEEKIFDWAYTVGSFGDLFVKVEGLPELGVINVNDDAHPLNYSRIDHQGVLIGFYETPQGQSTSESARQLIPPWEFVHLRLLGAKRKRPIFSDPMYSEFRTMHLMTGTDTKMVTSRYGVSLLIDALPTYKRLRLAEDSLLLARLTRGILRYIWKLKVDSQNMEAVGELVDQYATIIKRARAINTRGGEANFDEKFGAMCLRGDTKIELCNGQSLTVKELTENLDKYIGKSVWSVNPDTLHVEPKKILSAQKTRLDAQLVRVYLDNNKYIDATPDHKFMLRDGTYREAQYLQPGQSLMPYYEKLPTVKEGPSGYKCIYDPADNKYHYAHKIVSGPVKRGFVVHHLDFNKLNNDPTNLIVCSNFDHRNIYHKKQTPETIEKIKRNQVAWLKGKTKETSPELAELMKTSKFYNQNLYTEEEKKKRIEKGLETKKRNGTLNVQPKGKDHPYFGKTWEEILGVEGARIRRLNQSEQIPWNKGLTKETDSRLAEVSETNKGIHVFITKTCPCGCKQQFRSEITTIWTTHNYIYGHNRRGLERPKDSGRQKGKRELQLAECLLNHKVVRVEWLQDKEDTYDITVEDNHNFALSVGVFVHNSAVEDLFIPVWGNTGDLTFDKIGGEVDIKWIVDIEDLRNQLACALRTPLQLLGGYVQETSGQMGSQAIEQLDVGFARSARRLQRAIKEGIRRICQIHLAYMNMDPDPRLFDVHMSETSTAEETAIKNNLLTGIDAVDKVMDTLEKVDPNLDKKGIVNYLNQKILKLDDFDINKFLKSATNVVVESKELNESEMKEKKLAEHFVVTNTDITSFLPLLERKDISFMDQTWQQKTIGAWQELYQNTVIKEVVTTNSDDKNQLNLNF
jgi:intein/homing endonuclease